MTERGPASLETVVRGFELAWLRRERPDIDAALAALTSADRATALVELVHAELELRLKAGEPARAEDYLRRYPQLEQDREQALSLIAREWELRRREPSLSAEEYLSRFPQFRAELQARLRPAAGAAPRSKEPVLGSVASFLEVLRDCRLLEPPQLEELARTQSRYREPRDLARELVQRNWLTPYQVNQVFLGRGRELWLGSYLLLERLGEGGMGTVFKARHQLMKRLVAIKLIRKDRLADAEAVLRFYREIRAAAQLAHPNIVMAHDAAQVGDTHLLVMEYVEGTDLARLVKKGGPLPVARACQYVRQAALGLQHAHERGLVHRDVKPANLLLSPSPPLRTPHPPAPLSHSGERGEPERFPPPRPWVGEGPGGEGIGTVKILDLGLARLTQAGEQTAADLTHEGAVMGTPDFIAPEQAEESHTVDIRADIYSLGCTLYFLLTGQVPFPGGTLVQKLMKHQRAEPAPVTALRPEVPPGLAAVLARMMAKRPEQRYQTPAETAAALEPFCGTLPPTAIPITPVTEPTLRVPLAIPVAESPVSTALAAPVLPAAAALAQGRDTPPPGLLESLPSLCSARGSRPGPGRRRPLLLAGVATLAVAGLLLSLFVFRVRTKAGTVVVEVDQPGAEVLVDGGKIKLTAPGDKEPVEIEVDEGKHELKVTKGGFQTATRALTLKAGERPLVRVHLEPLPDPAAAKAGLEKGTDPDRAAAEWAFGIGVSGNGIDVELAGGKVLRVLKLADLPRERFSIRAIDLWGNARTTDDGLARLAGLKSLEDLGINGAGITDAGLRHLASCPGLKRLDLTGTRVSDAGLKHLNPVNSLEVLGLGWSRLTDAGLQDLAKNHPRLKVLIVNDTKITDTGLESLAALKDLVGLDVSETAVTSAGLRRLAGLTALESLSLQGTAVGNEGLKHLRDLKALRDLRLGRTRVTDAGLDNLQELTELRVLWLADNERIADAGLKALARLPRLGELGLSNTTVSDAGVVTLQTMTGLKLLNVRETKMTADGVKQLRAALPGCQVFWDDPKAGAGADLDRRGAEWVLKAGAKVVVIPVPDAPAVEIDRLDKLPLAPFRLTAVLLQDSKELRDDDLGTLRGLKNLAALDLSGTSISDAGLGQLRDLPGLRSLALSRTHVTDAGLERLEGAEGIDNLVLYSTAVTGKGLARFRNLRSLQADGALNLGDVGLAALRGLTRLESLVLGGDRQVTDAGLKHLRDLKALRLLNLTRTGVTDAGLDNLQELTELRVLWLADNERISDAGLKALARLPHLEELGLWNTAVSDAGVATLKTMSGLKLLKVKDTKVTADGVKQLRAVLPNCQVEWDAPDGAAPPGK
jgi:serine/threonine protein kinase/Leucine-rich repeat (LRR) protein